MGRKLLVIVGLLSVIVLSGMLAIFVLIVTPKMILVNHRILGVNKNLFSPWIAEFVSRQDSTLLINFHNRAPKGSEAKVSQSISKEEGYQKTFGCNWEMTALNNKVRIVNIFFEVDKYKNLPNGKEMINGGILYCLVSSVSVGDSNENFVNRVNKLNSMIEQKVPQPFTL